MSKKDTSRFDALFGAARAKPIESEKVELKHSDVQTSKSKDPTYQRTTIYLPKAVHRKLKAAAANEDKEMSDIVTELVPA